MTGSMLGILIAGLVIPSLDVERGFVLLVQSL